MNGSGGARRSHPHLHDACAAGIRRQRVDGRAPGVGGAWRWVGASTQRSRGRVEVLAAVRRGGRPGQGAQPLHPVLCQHCRRRDSPRGLRAVPRREREVSDRHDADDENGRGDELFDQREAVGSRAGTINHTASQCKVSTVASIGIRSRIFGTNAKKRVVSTCFDRQNLPGAAGANRAESARATRALPTPAFASERAGQPMRREAARPAGLRRRAARSRP